MERLSTTSQKLLVVHLLQLNYIQREVALIAKHADFSLGHPIDVTFLSKVNALPKHVMAIVYVLKEVFMCS
jgi:hypothetical protein